MASEEIRDHLYQLRRGSREKYLELMGVDIPAVRGLEAEIDAEYQSLADDVQGTLANTGQDITNQHAASLERAESLIRKEADKRVEYATGLDRRVDTVEQVFGTLVPVCIYYSHPALTVDHGHCVCLDPPSGGASGSVTYNAAVNAAHPLADSGWGQGTGTINSARVVAWFKFAFTPSHDHAYCIHPIVQMNGHWLVWTWGTCGGTPEDRGTGVAKLTLQVQVDQLSSPVKQIEHQIFEKNASAGNDIDSGFGYDSEVNGGAHMTVSLQGGHEAVIWVKCEAYVRIENHGRAWVDMQSSPFFYFKVPAVYYAWSTYWLMP